MLKRLLLLGLLVAVFAWPAFAVNTTRYPTTLVEQTCTDSYDVPAAQTGGSIAPAAQTSGSGDDWCDHDSRISTDAAFVADTLFGPFRGGRSACYIIFADGNTVSGGDTKWGIVVQAAQPHDGVVESLDAAVLVTGVVDKVWMVGLPTEYSYSLLEEELNVRLPNRWYLLLDLETATSWLGEISMVGC